MSPRKTFFCMLFLVVHMVVIVLVSVNMGISTAYYLYEKELPGNKVYSSLVKVINNSVFTAYTKYTGADMGYGFFAPNVLSSGYIYISKNGRQCDFKLTNQESWIRYMDLCHLFISRAIVDSRHVKNDANGSAKPTARSQEYVSSNKIKYSNVDSTYYDLLLKSISYRYMADFKPEDTLVVQLRLMDYTKLAQFKKRSNLNMRSYIVYEKKYFLHNKQEAF